MKKNLKKIIIILIVIIVIIIGAIYFIKNRQKQDTYKEYEPEQEISEEQERQTMISLYFINKTTRKVEPEARLIDVKELITNPYEVLINLLIEGPRNESHEKAIPEGTKLLEAKMEGEILILNFSEEFINNHVGGKIEEENTITSIVNTLTELTEVDYIKILINGEENRKFKDGEIELNQNFVRND
ncbi:MAG: GerMN domain-containing protein [Clostridia bacterium]